MDNKFGVIDLGSNTFHLLIVEIKKNGDYAPVFKERTFVGLAENGIELLSASSMEKGLNALRKFKKILKERNVNQYSIIGTSALRSAGNSSVFLDRVNEDLGIHVEVIDGIREAELIYKGVSQLIESNEKCNVIIDVGGGSVEFIVVEKGQMIWSQSFNLGVGVLHNIRKMNDPCNEEDIEYITEFIDQKLKPLKSFVSEITVDALIGASGSFEVIQTMNGDTVTTNSLTEISLDDYFIISKKIISSSVTERLDVDGLPKSRVKLIVVAMILINKAIEIIKPKRLLVSPYALKEGLVSELIEA